MRTKLKRALFGVMAGIMVANTPLTTLAAYTPANEPDDTTGHSAETASDKEAKKDQEEKSILEQKNLYTYLGEMEEEDRKKTLADLTDEQTYELVILLQYEYLDTFNQEQSLELYKETVDGYWKNIPELKTDEEKKEYESKLSDWQDTAFKYVDTEEKDQESYLKPVFKEKSYGRDLYQILTEYVDEKNDAEKQAESEEAYETLKTQIFSGGGINQDTSTDKKETPDSKDETSDTIVDDKESKGTDDSEGTEKKDETVETPDESKDEQEPEQKDEQKNEQKNDSEGGSDHTTADNTDSSEETAEDLTLTKKELKSLMNSENFDVKKFMKREYESRNFYPIYAGIKSAKKESFLADRTPEELYQIMLMSKYTLLQQYVKYAGMTIEKSDMSDLTAYLSDYQMILEQQMEKGSTLSEEQKQQLETEVLDVIAKADQLENIDSLAGYEEYLKQLDVKIDMTGLLDMFGKVDLTSEDMLSTTVGDLLNYSYQLFGMEEEMNGEEVTPKPVTSSRRKARSVMAASTTPSNGSEVTIANGAYYFYVNTSNFLLDIANNGTGDKTNVDIWNAGQSGFGRCEQKWVVIRQSDGWYKIFGNYSRKCLDVYGGGTGTGQNINLYTDNGSASQRWKFYYYNGKYIVKSKLGTVLDVNGGTLANGTNVQTWSQNNSGAQLWRLQKITNDTIYLKPGNSSNGHGYLASAPINNMGDAYRRIQYTGGTIYVMESWNVTSTVTLTSTSYSNSAASGVNLLSGCSLNFKRYSGFKGNLIVIQSNGNATFKNLTFDGNKGNVTRCSAMMWAGAGKIYLNNCTFQNANSYDNTSCVVSRVNLTIDNCTFKNNYSNREHNGNCSAHLWIDKATANINGCTFQNNEKSGAVNLFYSKGIFKNCKFLNNGAGKTNDYASALGINAGDAELYNCDFTGNYATEDGGAIHLNNNPGTSNDNNRGHFYAEGCSFTNNGAGDGAAAIMLWDTRQTATIKNCTFTNNTANVYAGAIAAWLQTKLILTGCTFTGNKATGTNANGGGVYIDSSQSGTVLTATGNTFDGNSTPTTGYCAGGAVRVIKGATQFKQNIWKNNKSVWGAALDVQATASATLTDENMTYNTSNGQGGAVHNNGTMSVIAGYYAHNTSTSGGGAICSTGALTLTSDKSYDYPGIFESNVAVNGGAIFSQTQSGSATYKFTSTGIQYTGNKAIDSGATISSNKNAGGAIYINNNTKNNTLKDNKYKSNSAYYGGAVHVAADATCTSSGETFVENSVNGGGGAFHSNGTSTITLGTFKKNMSSVGGGAIESAGITNISNSKLEENTADEGGAIHVCQVIDGTTITTKLTSTANDYISNAARKGGAIEVDTKSTVDSFNDNIQGCSATQIGGAFMSIATLSIYGGTIGNEIANTAGEKGGAVYHEGKVFNMSNDASIDKSNDVYLTPGKYITVPGILNKNFVARITPSDYTPGRTVVKNTYGVKGSTIEPKFTLTPKTGFFLKGGDTYSVTDNADVVISRNYPITYDCGTSPNPTGHFSDGTNLDDEDVKEWGVDYEIRTDKPTAKGYLFSGWNTEEDGSGDDYFPGDTYSENEALYLYAQWTPIKYAVTYNGNGSTSGSMLTQTFTYGKSYNLAANGFVRSNYHFAGWNTKADGSGTSYSDKQSVKNLATKNGTKVTLYAQWAKNTYTIRFHANGGAGSMADVTVPYDTVYSLPKNQFTLKGYQFDEWIDADHSMAIDDEGNISRTSAQSRSDVVDLYAQWTPNEYYVAYNSNKPNGATGNISGTMAKSNHEYDTSNNLTANGYRLTGWTFQNWNTKADGSGTSYTDKQSVTNLTATNGATVTLYAQWKANTYTVKYDGNGSTGGSTASSSHTYDTAKALTANGFTKTGYTFKGWNTKADGSGTAYADKASVKNLTTTNGGTVTLYAQWTAKKYTVAYNANGGSGTMAADTATYGSGYVTKENAFSRTGYTFKGWNEKADGTGTDWTSWIGKSWTWTYTKNITLYAQWTVNKYTLTITGDSGVETITGNGTYNYGTTANVTYQIKSGYHIKNITGTTADGDPNGAWTGHTGKSGTVTDTWTVKACNRTIVVHTEPNTYTIKYDGNGNTGGSTANSNHTYDAVKALTANGYTRTGYSFNGWNTKANGSGTAYADEASVKNMTTTNGGTVTLYAQWTKNSYYLDLNGWLDGKSAGNIAGYGTADIYVDGVQKANDVTDFYQKIPYGSKYEIKDIKTVTGHTYVGVHSGSITGTIGASNVGVVLEFKTNKYTVTFDKNNGTGTMTDQTFTYGVKQALTKNAFTRTGYTFAGWNTQADGKGTAYTDQQEVTSLSAADGATVRLYARWTAISYTVAYDGNGSTGGSTASSSHTYDTAKALTANGFTRTGYTFKSWNTKADGSGTSYADKASVKNLSSTNGATVTLYAQWTANKYTVAYNANGGTGTMATDTVSYGTGYVTKTNAFNRTGYTFKGWNEKADGTGSDWTSWIGKSWTWTYTKNITLYAQWTINQYSLIVNPNGGIYNGTSSNTTKTVDYGTKQEVNELPTKDGYTFQGWNRTGSGSLHSGLASEKSSTITMSEKRDDDGTAYTKYTMNYTNTGTGYSYPNLGFFYYPYVSGHTYRVSYDVRVNTSSGFGYSLMRHAGFRNNWEATANDIKNVTDGWKHKTIERTFTGTEITQNNTANAINPLVEWYGSIPAGKTGVLDMDLKNLAVYDVTTGKYVESKTTTVKNGATIDMGAGNTTLTAVWKANNYTIKYNGNGNTGGSTANSSHTYNVEKSLTANGYTRTGYTFKNWNTKADGSGVTYTDKQVVKNLSKTNGDTITLYAQWTANQYQLTLNPNSGSFADGTTAAKTVESKLVYATGNCWNISSYAVVKTGYTLDGWYDKASGGEKVYTADGTCVDGTYWKNKTYQYDGNLTVYAHWTANKYTVTYNANGGSGTMATDKATYGAGYVTKANAFSRTGYTFVGWNEKADGTGTDWTNWIGKSWTWTYTKNITLYAQWRINQYTLTITGDSGVETITGSGTYNYGAIANVTYQIKPGYHIKNITGTTADGDPNGAWTGHTGKSGTVTDTWTVKACNRTIVVHTEPNTYTIKYDGNGNTGGSTANSNHTYDAVKALTANGYTRTGYSFNGWNTKADGSGIAYADKASVKNLTSVNGATVILYAQWSINSYTLTYNPNGGSVSPTSKSLTYNSAYGTLPTPTRKGYAFTGWFTAASGGTKVSESTKMGTGNITIYAHWKANVLRVNYYPNGATKVDNSTAMDGFGVSTITPDVQYRYDDFNYDATMPSYGLWDARRFIRTGYTSTNKYHLGSKDGTVLLDAGNNVFAKTQDLATAAGVLSDLEKGNVSISIYADWKANTYTIKYNGNGNTGGSTAGSSHTYDTAKGLTANGFTKTGYTFKNWNTKADGSGTSYADKASVKNLSSSNGATVTLYAQWTANKYTVTYNANGGTGTMANQELTYDKAATLNANTFKRTGYRFNGWNTKADGTGTSYADKASVKNLTASNGGTVTLYAKWYSAVPELEAKDATYYEGQDITKAMLLKNVTKASDVEDGDMTGKVIITKIEYSAGKLVDGKPQAAYTKSWTNGMPDSEKLDTWFQQLPKEKAPVTHKITYQVTDLSGKTTTKTSTITVKYNEFPVIKAEDRYFTLEEAKSGKITKDVLLKEAIASGKLKAEDKEDGVISNKVTILDYKDTDFKNVNGNATVTVIFKVNDSMGPSGVGKETVCEVKVKIIDSGSDYWRDDDGTARKQVRFITQKYYDKNKDTDFHGMTSEEIEASSDNGGLNVMSKWYQNAAYKALLTGSFAKDAGTDYKISAEKAKELKQKIESNGIGNSKSSNALTDIYNSLK